MGLGCVEQEVGMWSRKRAGVETEGLVPGLHLPNPPLLSRPCSASGPLSYTVPVAFMTGLAG